MRRITWMPIVCIAFAASTTLHGEEPAAAAGKKIAADSGIRWDVREVKHPLLGPIKFAVQRDNILTPVGKEKIVSLAYVSCQKASGRITIELTSAPASAPASGLGPADLPRLVCNVPAVQGGALAKSDLAASWEISALGDALARGLAPAALRRCASIDVLQNLALPPAWPRENQRVAMQITPYSRELDAVLAECGEATAFEAPAARPALAPTPVPAPTTGKGAMIADDSSWQAARATAKGRTNVRAAASIDSAVVIQLDPGALILVQPASSPWWKVKPRRGAAFSGYIRDNRFELDRPRR